MQTQRIELGLLRASAQPRPLQTADVDKLAASIREIGLIQPVTVRAAIINGNVAKDGFQIVAGHHRVAAARALGWTEIDAIVVQAEGHLEAELIEIDENLVRSELSVAQRAHYTARRKEVWEALHPEPTRDYGLESYDDEGNDPVGGATCATNDDLRSDGRKKGPQHHKGFAAATAEVTGESKAQINRNVARAEAIGPDILKLSGTSLDKGVELDALAKLPEPERKDLIERATSGEVVTARVAPTPAPTEAPTPAPTEAPTEAPLDDTDDAQYIVKELRLLLTRLRSGMSCDTDKQLGIKARNAIKAAPEDVFTKYAQARDAVNAFMAAVAEGNE